MQPRKIMVCVWWTGRQWVGKSCCQGTNCYYRPVFAAIGICATGIEMEGISTESYKCTLPSLQRQPTCRATDQGYHTQTLLGDFVLFSLLIWLYAIRLPPLSFSEQSSFWSNILHQWSRVVHFQWSIHGLLCIQGPSPNFTDKGLQSWRHVERKY